MVQRVTRSGDSLEAVLACARSIAADVIEPNAEVWNKRAVWPEPAVRALQEAGMAGLVVPAEHGGLGQGMAALVRVCEVLGHADASTALCYGMHSVAAACVTAKATGDQAQRFLRPIAAGRHWTTLALSEPGTGSHFYLPQVTMRGKGESYELSGTKSFVTNGGHADSYVVSTSAAGDAEPGHFSMVVVTADVLAGSWGGPWDGWGMRANSSRSVTLDEVRVPGGNLLGEEGDEIWYVFNVVAPYFLVAMCGTYLGIASRAFEEARASLKRRVYAHTGAPLAEIDVLQHRLGVIWARFQRTRQLCYWAAGEADGGGAEALTGLCAAKAEVGHAAIDIANDCMTLAGGVGYRNGAVLPRLLCDARAAHVMSPTTDILYTWAGRSLLGLPLLGR
jgi:alkylation response protein AidB-like acyl-CoA dehydrogenase